MNGLSGLPSEQARQMPPNQSMHASPLFMASAARSVWNFAASGGSLHHERPASAINLATPGLAISTQVFIRQRVRGSHRRSRRIGEAAEITRGPGVSAVTRT